MESLPAIFTILFLQAAVRGANLTEADMSARRRAHRGDTIFQQVKVRRARNLQIGDDPALDRRHRNR
jgi:hypothetical protein